MMVVLNPTYSLRVVIQDASPQTMTYQAGSQTGMAMQNPPPGRKWWDPLAGKTGCDNVLAVVKDALAKAGLEAQVSFDRFELR